MTQAAFEFGEFRLDREGFTLSRAGRVLRLERKPLELLILLVERSGQLVSRTEIAQHLWGAEVFVDTEHGINTAVRKIRHALRDDSEDPQFIQTVTGKGYRLLAPVNIPHSPGAVALSPRSAAISAVEAAPTAPLPVDRAERRRRVWPWVLGLTACALATVAGLATYRLRLRPPEVEYTQLTDFTDSAVRRRSRRTATCWRSFAGHAASVRPIRFTCRRCRAASRDRSRRTTTTNTGSALLRMARR